MSLFSYTDVKITNCIVIVWAATWVWPQFQYTYRWNNKNPRYTKDASFEKLSFKKNKKVLAAILCVNLHLQLPCGSNRCDVIPTTSNSHWLTLCMHCCARGHCDVTRTSPRVELALREELRLNFINGYVSDFYKYLTKCWLKHTFPAMME